MAFVCQPVNKNLKKVCLVICFWTQVKFFMSHYTHTQATSSTCTRYACTAHNWIKFHSIQCCTKLMRLTMPGIWGLLIAQQVFLSHSTLEIYKNTHSLWNFWTISDIVLLFKFHLGMVSIWSIGTLYNNCDFWEWLFWDTAENILVAFPQIYMYHSSYKKVIF